MEAAAAAITDDVKPNLAEEMQHAVDEQKNDIEEDNESLPSSIDDNATTGDAEDVEATATMTAAVVAATTPQSGGGSDTEENKQRTTTTSFFSLTQVTRQLGGLLTSARERVFGEDYWIPTDANEIVVFPAELLVAHARIFPHDGAELFAVCQGSLKNSPETTLYHVTLNVTTSCDETKERQTLSIFRSYDAQPAIDLCQSCLLCQQLFTQTDRNKDIRRTIGNLLAKLKAHPLWKAVHVAAHIGDVVYFEQLPSTDVETLVLIFNADISLFSQLNTVCHPEGLLPLMMAIESNQLNTVKCLMKLGADPSRTDVRGNNAMHFAALASVQMLETLWSFESVRCLINIANNDGCTPLFIAIRNANPRCTSTLLGFGAELHMRCTGKSPLFEAMQTKGKSTEVIKTLLDASPAMLHDRDAQTGNTALHAALFKTPLMGLLALRRNELDLNARNLAGQTPLHMHAHREDIGCVTTMVSYDIDLDARDNNGNTPMHIVVSKANVDLTRLLLCRGANPNVRNDHGDTPRHLAANADLLRSLTMCGARRCPPDKIGCSSGCVERHTLVKARPSRNSSPSISSKSSTPTRSTGSKTKLLSYDFDSETEETRPTSVDTPRESFIHQRCCENMKRRLRERKTNDGGNFVSLLSLDGGGIRGLVIIQILLAVEAVMGESIYNYFDWVAGTSTGSLIAAALAQGLTLRDCQRIYLRFKDMIFDGWSRPYNTTILEQFIKLEMGVETTMADIPWPRLVFTTTRADTFPVSLRLIRNYRQPIADIEDDEDFGKPADVKLWRALRCSSAAPTYFSSVDARYIDGGIIANNPTIDLISEVQRWNNGIEFMKKPKSSEIRIGCVLSIGTGSIPICPMDVIDVEISTNPYTTALAMKNLGIVLIDQVTATEGAPVARSRHWCQSLDVPFFRLSAPLSSNIAIDTKDDRELTQMMWDCVEYTFRNRAYIDSLVDFLRLIGPSHQRRHLFTHMDRGTCDMQTQTSVGGDDDGK